MAGIRLADEIRLHHGRRDWNRRGTCRATPTRRLAGVREYRNSPPDRTRWFGMPNVIAVPCDVTDPDQVLAAARTVGGHTGGRLNLLINNAGYSPHEGVIEAASMTEYRRAFEVNFWGPVQVVQAMTPLLRASKGRIINTTSGSVYITIPMYSAYPTSKSALKTFTRHLRMELAPFGIEVTSLEPGGVETAMAEMGPEVEARQWASTSEPLRERRWSMCRSAFL